MLLLRRWVVNGKDKLFIGELDSNSMAVSSNTIITFLLIFFGTFIVAKVFDYILNNYLSKIFKKTKGRVDDRIFDLAVKPLHYFVVVGGIYFAFHYLQLTNAYGIWVDRVLGCITAFKDNGCSDK